MRCQYPNPIHTRTRTRSFFQYPNPICPEVENTYPLVPGHCNHLEVIAAPVIMTLVASLSVLKPHLSSFFLTPDLISIRSCLMPNHYWHISEHHKDTHGARGACEQSQFFWCSSALPSQGTGSMPEPHRRPTTLVYLDLLASYFLVTNYLTL